MSEIKITKLSRNNFSLFDNFYSTYNKEINKKFKKNKNNIKSFFLKFFSLQNKIFFNWIIYKESTIGFVIFNIKKSEVMNIKKVLIRDIFILKKLRKKYIGGIVLKKLKLNFKKKKIKLIEIEILKNNKRAKKFWIKNNFKLKSYNFFYKI